MRDFCPRCETPFGANAATCPACGYRVTVPCPTCGKPNVAQAMFCGACGTGMHLSTRLTRRWEAMASLSTRLRLKNLGAGFLFGSVLALFAFGSMGMSRPDLTRVQPVWERAEVESPFATKAGRSVFANLTDWKAAQEEDRHATLGDLVKVGDLLLQSCHPVGSEGPSGAVGEAGARRFLQNLGSRLPNEAPAPLRRSEAALFFYRMAGELLSLKVSDNSSYRFADIPRYHYLNIPAESLEAIGVRIAREPELFGGEDPLTVADLSEISKDFLKAYEDRLKSKEFSALDPAAS
ncbi:MAG: zinc ribbon domain-containing protein [Candidatus Riflebacteria bacterium]|nr:zinc ribbon domain-containing protein [Candidatus Riflebacteria bacterium]